MTRPCIWSASFLLFAATSAGQAKTLVCSNTGIITEEMVDIVASYDPESQPENALVEGGRGEPADNAYFLIHSTEVGALQRCIAQYGLALEPVKEAIELQWDRFINPLAHIPDPPDNIPLDAQRNFFHNLQTGLLFDADGNVVGVPISAVNQHIIQGKPVTIRAANEVYSGDIIWTIGYATGAYGDACFVNEECHSKIRDLLSD